MLDHLVVLVVYNSTAGKSLWNNVVASSITLDIVGASTSTTHYKARLFYSLVLHISS